MAGANATVTSTCPAAMKATSNGVFQGDNPLDFALPLAILQICIVVVLTRVLAFLLRPLRQPRVIAEIVGGILLGPSALGRNKHYLNAIFPSRSLTVLDTLANLGLLFFLFLVGLELDLKSLRRTGKKALSIAIAGVSLPFALGIGTSFVLRGTISKGVNEAPFLVFMGVALSITAFPVLARILAELKLLTTDVGRMAMSAAAVNDVAAWILLALAIALSGTGRSPLVSLWVFLCGSGFVLCCMFIVPPIFNWMAQRCPEGEPVEELYVCATLAGVLAAILAPAKPHFLCKNLSLGLLGQEEEEEEEEEESEKLGFRREMALAGRIRSGLPLLTKALRSDPLSAHRSALTLTNSEFSRNYATTTGQKEEKIKVPLALFGGSGNYASALYLAAVKGNALDKVESELLDLVEASKRSPTFAQFTKDLSVPADTRVKALQEISAEAKFSDLTKNFLVLLAENGRLRHIDSIAKRFVDLTMAHKGEVKAVVTTVIPLPPEEEKELKETLQEIIGKGKKVKLEQKIDPAILGGLVVEFELKVFDMSIKTRARQMERFLREPINIGAL